MNSHSRVIFAGKSDQLDPPSSNGATEKGAGCVAAKGPQQGEPGVAAIFCGFVMPTDFQTAALLVAEERGVRTAWSSSSGGVGGLREQLDGLRGCWMGISRVQTATKYHPKHGATPVTDRKGRGNLLDRLLRDQETYFNENDLSRQRRLVHQPKNTRARWRARMMRVLFRELIPLFGKNETPHHHIYKRSPLWMSV